MHLLVWTVWGLYKRKAYLYPVTERHPRYCFVAFSPSTVSLSSSSGQIMQPIITVFLFRFAYEIYVRTYIYENVLHSPDPGIDWPAPVSGPLYRLSTLCTCRGAFRRKWKLR